MIFNNVTNEQIKRILSKFADYLPKSGGTIDGNIELKSTSAVGRKVVLENSKRRITLEVDTTGTCYLWDATNNKALGAFPLDGTNTFNCTANFAYAIRHTTEPYDATGLTVPQLKEYLASWSNRDTTGFKTEAIRMGNPVNLWNSGDTTTALGWGGWWHIIQLATDSTTNYAKFFINGYGNDELYYVTCTKGAWSKMQPVLHTGNSTAVKIQSTAPTDTSALWVW